MSDEIPALEEAVRALPGNLPLRRQLATALAKASRHDDALAQIAELLARAPDDSAMLTLAARCHYEVGQFKEALARYDAAVAKDPGQADAALRNRIVQATHDPRARIRLVADGPAPVDEIAARNAGKSTAADEDPPVTFSDIGGLDELKEKIRLRVIYPLKRPELYAAYGKKAGGGLLLYGPPGCGKTYLARATAGEAGVHFVGVGVEDVLDMWLGQSEKKLGELFRSARSKAPALLFFDEVDALGGRRSSLRHESYRTLVTQFLAELDGVGTSESKARATKHANEGLLVIGATNAPWDVDPAFRRPGRFGDVLFVPPPDLRARVEILKLKLVGKPQTSIDVPEIARRTELYSGADLGHVVDAACETLLQAALSSGQEPKPLTTDVLLGAVKRVRPTTREWFSSARNFASYANETGQYDEVVEFMRRHNL